MQKLLSLTLSFPGVTALVQSFGILEPAGWQDSYRSGSKWSSIARYTLG